VFFRDTPSSKIQQSAFSVQNAPTLHLQLRDYTDCKWENRLNATGREPVATASEPVATQTDPVATGYELVANQTDPVATGTVTVASERVGAFSIQNAPSCITKHYIYIYIYLCVCICIYIWIHSTFICVFHLYSNTTTHNKGGKMCSSHSH
jgi:hypothetical protein